MSGARSTWVNMQAGGRAIRAHLGRPDAEAAPTLVIVGDGAELDLASIRYADRWVEEGYVTIAAPRPEGDIAAWIGALEALAAREGIPPDRKVAILGLMAGGSAANSLARAWQASALVLLDPDASLPAGLVDFVPCQIHQAGAGQKMPAGIQLFAYPEQAAGFFLPDGRNYDRLAAGIAHSRILGLLRQAIGPRPDLAALFREHLRLEFEARDADATMRTMIDEPYVNHVPTMTGGFGHDQLKRFYKHHFIPSTPKDRKTVILSEIVGADSVVIEAINCFTHAEPYDHFLPGVPPTGRYLEIPFVAIAKFKGDKLFYEQIYWDQASVLVQLGLLDPDGLPVTGRDQAAKVRDPSLPSNALMTSWPDSEDKPL